MASGDGQTRGILRHLRSDWLMTSRRMVYRNGPPYDSQGFSRPKTAASGITSRVTKHQGSRKATAKQSRCCAVGRILTTRFRICKPVPTSLITSELLVVFFFSCLEKEKEREWTSALAVKGDRVQKRIKKFTSRHTMFGTNGAAKWDPSTFRLFPIRSWT